MKVIVSDTSRRMVYHRSGCRYAARIRPAHRMTMELHEAESYGYRECACCGGLEGFVRVSKPSLDRTGRDLAFEYLYVKDTDTLYIRTEVGFWKIYRWRNAGYLLFHSSEYREDAKFEDLMTCRFHRQADVREDDSIFRLIHYLEEHDKAKKIIREDYKKLPRRTKKQKKYYKQAEKKARWNQLRRLDELFDSLKEPAKVV